MTKPAFPRTLASLAVTSALVLCQAGTPSQASTFNQVSAPAPNQAQTSHSPYLSTMFPADRILTRRQAEHMLRTEIKDLLHTLKITNPDPPKITVEPSYRSDEKPDRPTNKQSWLEAYFDIHRYLDETGKFVEYEDAVQLTKNSRWTTYTGGYLIDAYFINSAGTVNCYLTIDYSRGPREKYHDHYQAMTCFTGLYIVRNGRLKEVPPQRRNSRTYSWRRSPHQTCLWNTHANQRRLQTVAEFVHALNGTNFDGFYTLGPMSEITFGFTTKVKMPFVEDTLREAGWGIDVYTDPKVGVSEYTVFKGPLKCYFDDYFDINDESVDPPLDRDLLVQCGSKASALLHNPFTSIPIDYALYIAANTIGRALPRPVFDDLYQAYNRPVLFQPEDLPDINFAPKHGWWYETDYTPSWAITVDRSWGG